MREFYRIFLILIIFSLSCYGQDKKRNLDIDALSESWIKLSSDSLLRMGDRLSIFPAAPDSALLCYSIVEAKEGARTERVKSLAMVEAMLGKAKLYSYRLQNYGEAYDCLMRALEIVDNTPSHNGYKPVIFFRLASVCHSLYEITKDTSMFEEALSKFSQSMDYAYSSSNYDEYDLSYLNLLSLCYTANDLESANQAAEYYLEHSDYPSDWKRGYNLLLNEGLTGLLQGNSESAVDVFSRQLNIIPNSESNIRYRYLTLACLTEAYLMNQQFDEALNASEESLKLSRRYKITDGELDAIRLNAKIWDAKGNNQESSYWKELELGLKDSLLSNANSSGLGNIKFNYELKKVANKLQQSEHKRRLLLVAICVVVAVLTLVGWLLWSIIVKNRRLRMANQRLFEDYQQKIEAMRNERQVASKESGGNQTISDECAKNQTEESENEMLDEETEQTYALIRQTVEGSELIFQTDFSLNMLASMMKLSSTKISRVINRHENINFPSFINRYRVMKACSMFEDSKFSTLTIETISQNVGFKSRAAFITAFKKETALTPSEYIKALKNR